MLTAGGDMANKFDEAGALSREPAEIQKGTRVQWTRSDFTDEYPPSDYRLILSARLFGGLEAFALNSSTSASGDHLFTVSSAVSGAWVTGEYAYQVEIERLSDSEKVFAYSGRIRVTPDLASSTSDPRSHAELMLSKIESILEGRADKDVSSYSINGRSLTKLTISELMEWRGQYRAEVRAERNRAAVKAGRKGNSSIGARFV